MISAIPNTPIATATKSMPSVSSGMPKVKRAHAGIDVGADQAEQQAQDDHGDRLQHRAVRQHHGRDQAEHHQREIFGRAELERDLRQRRRATASNDGARLQPAKNEPSAAMASAGPARPCRAIW